MAKLKKQVNVMILLSGGVDSTALIHFYKKLKANINCLFIDFGQLANKAELRSVKRVTKHFGVKYDVVKLETKNIFKDGEITGRNLFFLSTALLYSKMESGIIAIGVHKGTDYIDCNKPFIESVNGIYTQYTNGKIVIGTPFLNLTKYDIFQFCLEEEVPLQLTYSCEKGKAPPCGKCNTCKEIKALYVRKVKQNYSPPRNSN